MVSAAFFFGEGESAAELSLAPALFLKFLCPAVVPLEEGWPAAIVVAHAGTGLANSGPAAALEYPLAGAGRVAGAHRPIRVAPQRCKGLQTTTGRLPEGREGEQAQQPGREKNPVHRGFSVNVAARNRCSLSTAGNSMPRSAGR